MGFLFVYEAASYHRTCANEKQIAIHPSEEKKGASVSRDLPWDGQEAIFLSEANRHLFLRMPPAVIQDFNQAAPPENPAAG
jgi:hypothetical protein